MGQWTTVAQRKDIPEGKCITFDHGGERIAVFNVQGQFYAIGETCPHAGGPLSEGYLEGAVLTCPWHGWSFDLSKNTDEDGACRFKVQVEGEEVRVELQ